jgi:hypothetical protein
MSKAKGQYPIRLYLRNCLSITEGTASPAQISKLKIALPVLARYLNGLLRDASPGSRRAPTYSGVALATGIEQDLVRDALYHITCGGNGLTIWRAK